MAKIKQSKLDAIPYYNHYKNKKAKEEEAKKEKEAAAQAATSATSNGSTKKAIIKQSKLNAIPSYTSKPAEKKAEAMPVRPDENKAATQGTTQTVLQKTNPRFLTAAERATVKPVSTNPRAKGNNAGDTSSRVGKALQSIGLNTAGSTQFLFDTARKSRENAVDYQHDSGLKDKADAALNAIKLARTLYGDGSKEHMKAQADYDALRQEIVAYQTAPDKAVSKDSRGYQTMQQAQQLQEEALEGTSGVGRFLGGTAINIADNLSTIAAAGGNPALAAAMMGAKAAAGRAKELTDVGASASSALGRGAISGAIETATEKIPLDNLMDLVKVGGKNALVNTLKQAGVEGTEEGFSYVFNYLADRLAKDPNAKFSPADLLEQIAAGAVSGLVFGAGGTAINALGRQYDNSAGPVMDQAMQMLQDQMGVPNTENVLPIAETALPNTVNVLEEQQKVDSQPTGIPQQANAAPGGETIIQMEKTQQVQPTAQERASHVAVSDQVRPERDAQAIAEDVERVSQYATALGENGSRVLSAVYREESVSGRYTPEEIVHGFYDVYNEAMSGKAMSAEGKLRAAALPESVRYMAESAGQEDARRAVQAKYFGQNAKLVRDENWKKANLSFKTSRKLDSLAKVLGVQVRFVDKIVVDQEGHEANAQYQNGEILISRNTDLPVMTAAIHESVHRLREASPEAYAELSSFVLDNMSELGRDFNMAYRAELYQTGNRDVLTEEMVADAYGVMLENSGMLDKIAREHTTILQRLADSIRDILRSISKAVSLEDLKLSQEERDMFYELRGDLRGMERAMRNALKTAEAQKPAGKATKNATQEGGATKMMLKRAEGKLDEYSTWRRQTIESIDTNAIVEDEQQLHELISEAFANPKSKKSLHLGVVPQNVIDRINLEAIGVPKELRGNLFKENREQSLEIGQEDIRHLIDDKSGMTMDDVYDYVTRLPEIVTQFDSVQFFFYEQGQNRLRSLRFNKEMEDGVYLSLEVVSRKKNQLETHNIFMDSASYVQKKKHATPMPVRDAQGKTSETLGGYASEDSVHKKEGNVKPEALELSDSNTKYSLKDSQGNTLSKEQAEYFKDSKVRDDNGNLKVMYHGTTQHGFTVFDPKRSDDGISLFFTDSVGTAESYSGTLMQKSVMEESFVPEEASAEEMIDWLEKNSRDRYRLSKAEDEAQRIVDYLRKQTNEFAEVLAKYPMFLETQGKEMNPVEPLAYEALVNLYARVTKVQKAREVWELKHAISDWWNKWQKMADLFNNYSLLDWEAYPYNVAFRLERLAMVLQEKMPNGMVFMAGSGSGSYAVSRDRVEYHINEIIDGGAGNYPVYLNVTNPLVINGNGSDWNEIRVPKKMRDDPIFDGATFAKTRAFAEYAKANGYDGVMIDDIMDMGEEVWEEEYSNIVIAFSSEQVKDIYNKKPTSNPDIRYSLKGEKANLSAEDRANLQTAKKMKASGKGDEEIYKETGWYTQSDGKWRSEIPDEIMVPENFSRTGLQTAKDAEAEKYLAKAKNGLKDGSISEETYEMLVEFAEGVRNKDYGSGKLPVFLNAPKLYEAYPQLRKVNLRFEKLSGMQGYTDAELKLIVLDPDGLHDVGQTVREGLAHEIQHIIQSIEGFARGSTPGDAGSYEAYRKAGGEIEARDVEDRLRMTPEERRATMPVRFSLKREKEVGIAYDAKTESVSPQYSLKTWKASAYVQAKKETAKEMAKMLGISEEKALAYIDSVNSIAKIIADDKARLDYEASPGRSSFVSNTEYGGSIDFSTVCKKRRLFTGTFEAIQKALPNTALTADEFLEIRSMMDKKGYEVSCGLCYVEGSRANMGQYAKQFLDEYKATKPKYVPNMAEINTPNGLEKIRMEHPEVYDAYEKFMNGLAQRKPKLYQLHTEYQGEILNKFRKKNSSVETKNQNGGLRIQSFSDFEIVHLLDMMQVVMDMSQVGLAGQAYTKVPDFAWALGDTGLKINLSLIAKGVDSKGRLILDEKEGMAEKDAMALRERYSENVGTIIVVFTDRQLKAAMADERIDYIIPFHRSQWNSAQYEAMGLPANAKDFTLWQNESYIKPVYNKNGKKQRPSNYMPNTYWDFSKSGKENAEAYLKLCAENNRRPKFHYLLVNNGDGSYSLQPDGSTDGYWKTLIDFKMYDNNGKGSPQMPVRPDFNMEQAERMLREYTGGHGSFPAAQDVVDEFVAKYMENHSGQQFSRSNRELLDNMIKQYGAIPKGEKPARDILLPRKTEAGKNVSQTVRTILEAGATPDELVPTVENLVASGDFSFDSYTDDQAMSDAESRIRKVGWAQALVDWEKSVDKGEVTKANTALGWALYNNAANSKDTKTSLGILDKMVGHQRNAAQALQATRILKKLKPETQLYQVQRSVESLQEELNERYGEKGAPQLVIDEELAENYMRALTEEERNEILKEIYRDIGRQMPSRFIDKWNAWRYLAMLGNPRTHVRNVVGNLGFAPVVATKNLTATAIEAAVSRVSGGKLNRTKSVVGAGKADRALLKAAWDDYAKVQETALSGGKYSDFANANKYIEEGRQIFKFKPLDAARKGNSKALDVEDVWFSQPHYAFALASYCKAHQISESEIMKGGKSLTKARAYAILEAQKATYRDTNAFSKTISELGRNVRIGKNPVRRGISLLMEGILPFRKTPANILARGIEYSPIGLMNGIKEAAYDVKHGTKTGAEAIDSISAGLTGTGLLALGVYLAAQGLIRGHGSGDEEENEYEELQGHQAYALEMPDGTSVTLDWLAPEALPFFVGVNLWEQTEGERDKLNLSAILSAVSTVSEPLLEMSCLQSLNDVFDAVGYATSDGLDGLPSALSTAAASYLTQGMPTILGQIERTGEDKRYSTYTTRNAFLTSDMQYQLGRASARVPGVDYQQIPYIDAWGRMEATGDTGARAFNNFVNPAYMSEIDTSEMEEELQRLYDLTGEGSILPNRAAKYFNVNGERKDLTPEEYVEYATRKGQKSYELLTDLLDSRQYRAMSDEERVKAIEEAYDFANQTAKDAISEYVTESWVQKATEAEKKYGISPETYIALKTRKAGLQSLKDANGETISNSLGLLTMQMVYNTPGLSEKQRQAMFEYLGVGKTVRHYNKALVEQKLAEMRKK